MRVIYFLQPVDGGDIKIGTTVRLSSRLGQLEYKTGKELAVLAVCDGGFPEENGLHRRFSHLHVGGEWFSPAPELLEFIGQHGRPWDGTDEAIRYKSIKIDKALMRWLKISAATAGQTVQEHASKLLRDHLATELDENPIKRLKPRPRKRPD